MSESVQQNQVEASLKPIRDMITVLANVPKAREEFTKDLNKKIRQVDKAVENLATILTDIKSMKGEVAEASRKIKQESTIGAANLQKAVKDAKLEAEGKCKASIDAVANELKKYQDEIKAAADDLNSGNLKLKINDLETNIKNILTEISQPKDNTNLTRFISAVKDVEAVNRRETGYEVKDPPGLKQGWKTAEDETGRKYYYKVDELGKPIPGVASTYTMPQERGGGRRRTRRRGGFRYDMSPQEKRKTRTLRSVRSIRSKKSFKTKSKRSRNVAKRSNRKSKKRRRRKR